MSAKKTPPPKKQEQVAYRLLMGDDLLWDVYPDEGAAQRGIRRWLEHWAPLLVGDRSLKFVRDNADATEDVLATDEDGLRAWLGEA
jgi:hypothetical protein